MGNKGPGAAGKATVGTAAGTAGIASGAAAAASGGAGGTGAGTTTGGLKKAGGLATSKMASMAELPKHVALTSAAGMEKDGHSASSFVENEGTMFSDLLAACDAALAVLVVHDESATQEKDKKEKKKGGQVEVLEEKSRFL